TAGGETCQFRHEKRFENQTGLAVLIATDEGAASIDGKIKRANDFVYERVGVMMRNNLVAIKDNGGASLADMAKKVIAGAPQQAIILMSDNVESLKAGAEACGANKPLLYGATGESVDAFASLAKNTGCVIGVKGKNLDDLVETADKLIAAGVKDMIIDTGARTLKGAFEDNIVARRSAVKEKFKPLGFPTIAFPCEMCDDLMMEAMIGSVLIAKYAGITVFSDLQGDILFPLLLEQLNLFTDPQRPMVVAEDIYPVTGPDENSPVLITCNFSLTYFIVSGEIEGSKVPSWLLIKDTEGLSVLTAWAAGKFGADLIAMFVNKSGILDKVKHRELIIPGYLATIKGELEEELPDWTITIGPREAGHLPAFLKEWKPAA
ncbi:MAG: acetyl-CoA decarbonylase/synthase complex subunit gamma, partial [Candidatus Electrothrix sp. GM3_4]|nr:acetyl-CoA decarbonylase/synthase complex subunit gamma [Candidatus Electrothrix sp. GM3_4]